MEPANLGNVDKELANIQHIQEAEVLFVKLCYSCQATCLLELLLEHSYSVESKSNPSVFQLDSLCFDSNWH